MLWGGFVGFVIDRGEERIPEQGKAQGKGTEV